MISSDKNLFFDTDENTNIGTIFAEIDGSPDIECPGLDEKKLPILPLRNMVLFPGVTLPITVGRAKSLQLVREAAKKKQHIERNVFQCIEQRFEFLVVFLGHNFGSERDISGNVRKIRRNLIEVKTLFPL